MSETKRFRPGERVSYDHRDYEFLRHAAMTDGRSRRLLTYIDDTQMQMTTDAAHIKELGRQKDALSRAAYNAPIVKVAPADLVVEQMGAGQDGINMKAVAALGRGGYKYVYQVVDALLNRPYELRVKCNALGELLYTEIVLWCLEQGYVTSVSPNMLKAAVMPRDEIEALTRFKARFGSDG